MTRNPRPANRGPGHPDVAAKGINSVGRCFHGAILLGGSEQTLFKPIFLGRAMVSLHLSGAKYNEAGVRLVYVDGCGITR